MNERIKELVKQATTYIDPTANDGVCWDFDKEKFAQLIVRECTEACLRMQLGNQYTPEEMLFQTKYRKIIKKHFGVE